MQNKEQRRIFTTTPSAGGRGVAYALTNSPQGFGSRERSKQRGSKWVPSWGKAEKLKNLKVKTIRPKTWHGLRQDGAGLLS
jgi:hypothetical protein